MDWREEVRLKMEQGKEIGRRKRLEHNKKVKKFFSRLKKNKKENE